MSKKQIDESKKLIDYLRSQGKSDQECLEWTRNAIKFLNNYKRIGSVVDNTWVRR